MDKRDGENEGMLTIYFCSQQMRPSKLPRH